MKRSKHISHHSIEVRIDSFAMVVEQLPCIECFRQGGYDSRALRGSNDRKASQNENLVVFWQAEVRRWTEQNVSNCSQNQALYVNPPSRESLEEQGAENAADEIGSSQSEERQ